MNKYKVQVIEDEINICNFMKMIFETHEYQAIFSQRGESGLTMFWSHHPDIVILDLGLPDMDGTEVIKQIRKASDTPIIVLSARSNEADKVEALDLGANDYITKPFGRRVTIGEEEIRLTQTEYNIVELLAVHAGKVLTYAEIIKKVWGYSDSGSVKKLQVNMANIRKKFGETPGEYRYIRNELGVGYRMNDEQEV